MFLNDSALLSCSEGEGDLWAGLWAGLRAGLRAGQDAGVEATGRPRQRCHGDQHVEDTERIQMKGSYYRHPPPQTLTCTHMTAW